MTWLALVILLALPLPAHAALIVEIWATVDDIPTEVLASATLTHWQQGIVRVDLRGSDFVVREGDLLALVLRSTEETVTWVITEGDKYGYPVLRDAQFPNWLGSPGTVDHVFATCIPGDYEPCVFESVPAPDMDLAGLTLPNVGPGGDRGQLFAADADGRLEAVSLLLVTIGVPGPPTWALLGVGLMILTTRTWKERRA